MHHFTWKNSSLLLAYTFLITELYFKNLHVFFVSFSLRTTLGSRPVSFPPEMSSKRSSHGHCSRIVCLQSDKTRGKKAEFFTALLQMQLLGSPPGQPADVTLAGFLPPTTSLGKISLLTTRQVLTAGFGTIWRTIILHATMLSLHTLLGNFDV